MLIHTVSHGLFKLDGGAMFGVVPQPLWSKSHPTDERNRCDWGLRSLLVEEGDRLLLVDCGMGDKQDPKFFSHYAPQPQDLDVQLAELGYHRDDITDVFLTHLHFDHCGGAIRRRPGDLEKFDPAFSNAVFWSTERHWKWATEPNLFQRHFLEHRTPLEMGHRTQPQGEGKLSEREHPPH